MFPEPKPLTAFALTDHKNRVFDVASLKGKWSFLFFGFTHCPDVCPTTLAELARARDNIARHTAGAEYTQFVFISVDPNRDTAGKLGQYVGYFDTAFLGVTGDDAQIANLAGQLGAVYQVAITPGLENYPVTHSTAVFLLDSRARYHAVFTPPHDAEAIGKRFKVVRELEAGNAVAVGDAWIRETPPGMTMMAGYMELRNNTSRPQVLVAASSSGFESVMIHRTIVKDGMAGMAHASRIELACSQREFDLCAGRLSSDADEAETDTARRRPGGDQPGIPRRPCVTRRLRSPQMRTGKRQDRLMNAHAVRR